MGMLDGFITLMTTDPATLAVIGDRAYKSVLPRDYTLPAVAIHRYGGLQEYDFDGPTGVREDQVQIDVYGDTATNAQTALESIRALITQYVGALPDGTIVQACYLEREMDMPFLANADGKGIAARSVLGFRVVSSN